MSTPGPSRHFVPARQRAGAASRGFGRANFRLPGPLPASNVADMALFKARGSSAGSEGGPAPRGSELSDAALCHALAAGEAWAAEVVYDRVEDVVEAVLYRLLGPGDLERDDLAQQALERVISTIVSGKF